MDNLSDSGMCKAQTDDTIRRNDATTLPIYKKTMKKEKGLSQGSIDDATATAILRHKPKDFPDRVKDQPWPIFPLTNLISESQPTTP